MFFGIYREIHNSDTNLDTPLRSLCVCLFVCLAIHPSIHLSVYRYTYLSNCLPIYLLSIYLSIYLSLCLSLSLSLRMFSIPVWYLFQEICSWEPSKQTPFFTQLPTVGFRPAYQVSSLNTKQATQKSSALASDFEHDGIGLLLRDR